MRPLRALLPTTLAAALSLILAVGPSVAFDLTKMTEDEQKAFGEAVRQYLIDHPDVLIEVSDALKAKQEAEQAAGDKALVASHATDLFTDPASYAGGNPQGTLTVVEFIDYRCGYCHKAHADVASLVQTDGNIRYIVKEFPILGDESVMASRFAIAALQVAGEDAYAKLNAGFYESFRGDVTTETLAAFATGMGIDPQPILAAMDRPEVTKVIDDNYALGSAMGIQGTPTFIIGDQVLRGYAPAETLKQLVDQARAG